MKNKQDIICKLTIQNIIRNKLTILNGRGSDKVIKNCNKPRSILYKNCTIFYCSLWVIDKQNIYTDYVRQSYFTKFYLSCNFCLCDNNYFLFVLLIAV